MSGERHRPKRSLGQNFLVDPNLRRKIVEAVPFDRVDRVLEIGPGRGALTEGLLERAPELVVIEKDRELAAVWAQRALEEPRLRAIEGDVLDHALAGLGEPRTTAVVGNIPYNLTTPILFHLLEPPRPAVIVLMVQREVADRILADPGTRAYGALSVGVRTVADVERLFGVPPSAFRPRPRVESTVIRIAPRDPPPIDATDQAWTRRVTRAAFQWRRKQLGKIVRDHPDLSAGSEAPRLLAALDIADHRRPETLSPAEFVALGRALRELAGSD